MTNLVLFRKEPGRSYEFKGVDFNTPWRLKDLDTGKKYDTYEEYEKEQAAITKKAKQQAAMKKARAAKKED